MLVRPVRPEEHTAAGRVVVDAYRSLPGGHLSGGYAELLADVARRSAEADVLVAVAGDGPDADDLVGCVTFVPGPSSPWSELLEAGESGVRMLAVRPDVQRGGVGRALLDACITRARSKGCLALMLHTTPWMTAAQHLYERAGFVRFPERDLSPDPEVPLLAYRLDLSGGAG